MRTTEQFKFIFFSLILMFMKMGSAIAGGYAFAWADKPTASNYIPSSNYAYNRLYGPENIKISRQSIGQYTVKFSNFKPESGSGGHVQVTAYGNTNSTCQVRNWYQISNDFYAVVLCFDINGNKVDSRYTILGMLSKKNVKSHAYAWASKPTTTLYNASSLYSLNPSNQDVKISRISIGRYKVSFLGMKSNLFKGGHVQVGSYGREQVTCKVQQWGPMSNNLDVYVSCFDRSGHRKDNTFNVLVNWSAYYPFFMSYAWGSNPTANSYNPSNYYSSQNTSIQRLSLGSYVVKFKGVGIYQSTNYQTHIQVSAYGTDNSQCKVTRWKRATPGSSTDSLDAYISCFSPSGAKVDTKYTVLALYPYVII